MEFDQFLPSLAEADAIGNHVLRMKRVLERFGESKIYIQRVDSSLIHLTVPFVKFAPRPGRGVIYHASIGTPLARFLLSFDVPVIIDYHNVTPPYFFAAFEPRVAGLCYAGQMECAAFARRSPLGIADSEFSERELKSMGFVTTATIPILTDFSRYDPTPSRRVVNRLLKSKKGTDILFVGRVSPNKRQEDLIKLFAIYKREYDPAARLFLIGRSSSDRYTQALKGFIERLDVADVYMPGSVPDPHLFAYYTAADVFVSMSEHEGFGVPFIEAMRFDLPIVAFAAAAVPETLGIGGLLVQEKDYEEIAALVHLVASDGAVRDRLIRAERERLEYFRPELHEERLAELLASIAR